MVQHWNHGTPQPPASASNMAAHQNGTSELELLRVALNQVDYGLVVVDVQSGVVQFANALGRDALEDAAGEGGNHDTGLRLEHGRVVTRRRGHNDLLRHSLERARAGLRGLLNLGSGGQTSAVAVVPLSAPQTDPVRAAPEDTGTGPVTPSHALLVFAKQQLCDDSTMALFAQERGLTSAEGQVLAQVCRGLRPSEIANHHGVRISTVRTQLRAIRLKTCTDTIRQLVQKVSVLPPLARHFSARGAA